MERLSARAKTASDALQRATAEKATLADARDRYRPIALRGALLYFLLCDISSASAMYQTSLHHFTTRVIDAAIASTASADQEHDARSASVIHVEAIVEQLTFHATRFVQRFLFERHRLIWTLMLAMRIEVRRAVSGRNTSQFHFVLHTDGALDAAVVVESTKPCEWLPEASWRRVLQLSHCTPSLRELPGSLGGIHAAELKAWWDSDMPESTTTPEPRPKDAFERLLLLRALREDRFLFGVRAYVADALGEKYLDIPPDSLETLAKEADELTPLLFCWVGL